MSDVILIQMPYASLARPSIALGLLKAYLTAAGIGTRVVYANLAFAEEIGLDIYRLADGTLAPHVIGEWTFSGAAFPEFEPDHDGYFELIEANAAGAYFRKLREIHRGTSMVSVLREVRRRAHGFVDRLARRVLAARPRIVGCTSMFQQHCASLAVLRRVRELDPDVVTMMGGANCEGPMGRATHAAFDWVDYVVSGEADGFVADLCRDILERGRAIPAAELPEAVFGPDARQRERRDRQRAAAEGGDGPLVALGGAEPPRAIVHELDETAIPDYDEYFESLAGSPLEAYVEPSLLMETSRGCWWGMKHHCTFCGLNGSGMVYRSKAPERVVAEIDQLTERYGLRRIEAVDNILDMRYMGSVLAELAGRDEPPSLFFEVKANLRREHVERFVEAGIRAIQPGIESLHAETLKLMDKGNSAAINVQLLKWVTELGIGVNWNFIIEIPGESDEWYAEMAEWLPLVQHLTPPQGVIRLRFDRFSPYHDRPDEYGLELVPYRTYSYVYPLSAEELGELAYFFESTEDLARSRLSGEALTARSRARPGLAALKQRIVEWKGRGGGNGASSEPAELAMRDDGDTLRIRDTRRVAKRREHRLRGLARRVYLACDRATKAEAVGAALERRFGEAETGEERIAAVLDELVADRLMLHLESRYLSLAVWEGRRPAEKPSPFGEIDYERAVHELAAGSLAAVAADSPASVPLTELFAP